MAGPLTAEHKAVIDAQLEAIKQAETEIKRAKSAGIDVSEFEQQAKDLREQLTRIKQAYFPTGRG